MEIKCNVIWILRSYNEIQLLMGMNKLLSGKIMLGILRIKYDKT